ncbi:MAG: hypothetical protein ACOZE5_08065 [Verrucomicrobiota bacterium]
MIAVTVEEYGARVFDQSVFPPAGRLRNDCSLIRGPVESGGAFVANASGKVRCGPDVPFTDDPSDFPDISAPAELRHRLDF